MASPSRDEPPRKQRVIGWQHLRKPASSTLEATGAAAPTTPLAQGGGGGAAALATTASSSAGAGHPESGGGGSAALATTAPEIVDGSTASTASEVFEQAWTAYLATLEMLYRRALPDEYEWSTEDP